MTAEIAIMNKTAVALAADSAVTIGQKIYNSVNKLFMLSKYHPIGIMINGNAEFMNIPWESIIKIYRKQLGQKKFDTVDKFANDFISFLDGNDSLFPTKVQENYFHKIILSYFTFIREEIDVKIKKLIEDNKKVNKVIIKREVKTIILDNFTKWDQIENLKKLPKNHNSNIIK